MMAASAAPAVGFTRWIEELARHHTKALAALALKEGLAAEEAVDAVQEAFTTFLGLPRARALKGDQEEAFAFLATIVRNASRNLRRRHHRARPHVELEALPLLDGEPSADELVARAETHAAVLGCVQQLAEIQHHVLVLRVMEEMSTAEVAVALGLAPGYVGVLLHRAKLALRICLGDAGSL